MSTYSSAEKSTPKRIKKRRTSSEAVFAVSIRTLGMLFAYLEPRLVLYVKEFFARFGGVVWKSRKQYEIRKNSSAIPNSARI